MARRISLDGQFEYGGFAFITVDVLLLLSIILALTGISTIDWVRTPVFHSGGPLQGVQRLTPFHGCLYRLSSRWSRRTPSVIFPSRCWWGSTRLRR